jgi:hypothetical protein
VAKGGTSKAGGTISQQAVVHPWLSTDAQQTNKQKQTNKNKNKQTNKQTKTNKQPTNQPTNQPSALYLCTAALNGYCFSVSFIT